MNFVFIQDPVSLQERACASAQAARAVYASSVKNKQNKSQANKSHFTESAFSWIIGKFQPLTFGYSANSRFLSVGISNLLELTHSGSLKQSLKVYQDTTHRFSKFLLKRFCRFLLPLSRPAGNHACMAVRTGKYGR